MKVTIRTQIRGEAHRSGWHHYSGMDHAAWCDRFYRDGTVTVIVTVRYDKLGRVINAQKQDEYGHDCGHVGYRDDDRVKKVIHWLRDGARSDA
jgi:hypothetical protein